MHMHTLLVEGELTQSTGNNLATSSKVRYMHCWSSNSLLTNYWKQVSTSREINKINNSHKMESHTVVLKGRMRKLFWEPLCSEKKYTAKHPVSSVLSLVWKGEEGDLHLWRPSQEGHTILVTSAAYRQGKRYWSEGKRLFIVYSCNCEHKLKINKTKTSKGNPQHINK